MIWFDIKKLEDKISNDELSDKDGFNYVMASLILTSIVLSVATNNANGWIKLLSCFVSVVINIWGFKAIYQANIDNDGKDFFKRFFAISWVIGMRLLVIGIIIGVLIGVIIGIISAKSGDNSMIYGPLKDFSGLIVTSLFTVICYLLMINSFRKLKPKSE
jgi:hypothetical protein